MSQLRFDPEEFERLQGLPEDDPERVRAERSGRLPAWRRMIEAFEAPPDRPLSPQELAEADSELEQRVARAIAGGEAARPARPRRAGSPRSWFPAWGAGGLRVALASAAIAIVAVAGWWSLDRPRDRAAVRSAGEAMILAVTATPIDAGVELRWAAVPGARMYRVVFFGSDLNERARVDSLPENHLTLRAEHLPAGLLRGQSVLAEVTAVRADDELSSKPISIRVP